MSTLMISILISLVIIIFVIIVFAAAITKGYSYKHTVDQIEDNPYLQSRSVENKDGANKSES
jgi:hypothetical protein